MNSKREKHASSAFTLIELLVVIAIIAILAVVVVLTLNPAQLLAQSRDANRVSDMATLQSAIGLYQTDTGGIGSMGTSSVIYVSLPDNTSSTCGSLGLPMLPSGNTYDCNPATSTRPVNGQGWVPLDFTKISSGVPFGSLPIDPSNVSSSGLYYTYTTNGAQYQIISLMESQKYKQSIKGSLGNGVDVAGSMQGIGPVGWWPLNEATGSIAYDISGNNDNGNWYGAQIGARGYYSLGRTGSWAGMFDGATTYVNIPANSAMTIGSVGTWCLWLNTNLTGAADGRPFGTNVFELFTIGYGSLRFYDPPYSVTIGTLVQNAWTHVCVVDNQGIATPYFNGIAGTSGAVYNPIQLSASGILIGQDSIGGTSYFGGLINDVRIYNRALSAVEIQAIYNSGK